MRILSPAWTLRVTVAGAGAKSVGLTAATIRPFTEASRTRVPWVTATMRSRSALATRLDDRQPAKSHVESATSATAAATPTTARFGRRLFFGLRTVSCADVSRIMASGYAGCVPIASN